MLRDEANTGSAGLGTSPSSRTSGERINADNWVSLQSTLAGGSPRVSTTVCAAASREPLPCPRLGDGLDLHGRGSGLTTVDPLDWLWLQQAHPPHDALGPQGVPRPQCQGCRAPSHAQQDLRRRVSACLSVGPREGMKFTGAKRTQWRM